MVLESWLLFVLKHLYAFWYILFVSRNVYQKTFCGKVVELYIFGFIEKVKYGAISFVFGSVWSTSILPISSLSQNETQAIKQKKIKKVKDCNLCSHKFSLVIYQDNWWQNNISFGNIFGTVSEILPSAFGRSREWRRENWKWKWQDLVWVTHREEDKVNPHFTQFLQFKVQQKVKVETKRKV